MVSTNQKAAGYIWSLGSVLFFVAILLYVFVLQPSGGADAERTGQIIRDWALASAIWRVETIAVILLTISSWYLANVNQSISWFLITFGHIVMMIMYALMLGAYPEAAGGYAESPRLFPMINDSAIWVFGVGNLLFLSGLTGVYYSSEGLNAFLRWTGTVISLLGAMASLALFLDLISYGDLMMGGPLILTLYLLNAYHGTRIANGKA
jgi:hypothetical protein